MAKQESSWHVRRRYRDFLCQRALIENWTHFVTLNFHRRWCSGESRVALAKWAHSVCHHMFRRVAHRPPPPRRGLYFFAYKEFTQTADPHWHLLVETQAPRADRFARLAVSKWRSIVPSGTADVQEIGSTMADRQRVAAYVTKAADTEVAIEDFCISTEFDLPPYCGATRD